VITHTVCVDTATFLPTGCPATSSLRVLPSDSHSHRAWSRVSHSFLKPNLACSCSSSSKSPVVKYRCSSGLKPNGVSSTCSTSSGGHRLPDRYTLSTAVPVSLFHLLTTSFLCNSSEHPKVPARTTFCGDFNHKFDAD
jgi:hypothetical protein